nr:MAG TPA: hypothetical protein [Caudoviricetes sp.]
MTTHPLSVARAYSPKCWATERIPDRREKVKRSVKRHVKYECRGGEMDE